jgi:hypothetical protein
MESIAVKCFTMKHYSGEKSILIDGLKWEIDFINDL